MASKLSGIRWLATGLVGALVIAACSGGSTNGAATTAPAAASANADPNVLPKPELTKVRIGIGAPNEPVQYAEKLADTLGFYQKFGLTAEITGFEGDGKALQALIAGQLDLIVGGAGAAITSVVTDTPTKVVAMNSTILDDGLFCTKDIKTASDVKGKTVAIGSFGGTAHGSALLMLKGLGLTPKDVTITQVGNEGSRIAALKGGSIGCAVISISQQSALLPLGLTLSFDLSKAQLHWGRSGLQARADFIAKNPNTVLAAVAATLLAQNSMFADTKTATEKFAEFAQIKPDAAAIAMNAFLGYGSRSMMFTADAFIAPRDVLGTVNPAMSNVDVTKAFDLSFLNRLKDSGFYQKNGIPLN
ncbi:MAG TPA: ABC transporter substrate-binding protein [Candidatus Limnocylindria bacterium]|nr:ABC transporter substrate-binding protein [Candidatus Limnocylindria bacterium]